MYKSEESGLFEYATAKIMKLMLAKELNKRLKASPYSTRPPLGAVIIMCIRHVHPSSTCMHIMHCTTPQTAPQQIDAGTLASNLAGTMPNSHVSPCQP